MKNAASLPRKSWKGQEVSLTSRIMRPIAVVVVCMMMAMVVLPTSGVAVAAKYNNNNNDNHGDTVRNIALIGIVGTALAFIASGKRNDDRNN